MDFAHSPSVSPNTCIWGRGGMATLIWPLGVNGCLSMYVCPMESLQTVQAVAHHPPWAIARHPTQAVAHHTT